MKKTFKVFLAAAICSCSLSMVSYAGTWQAEGENWKYLNDDASYAAGGWIADNGQWYYLDASGYMKTGWVLDQGNWYYLNPTGEMRREPLTENLVTYYFAVASGACMNPNAAELSVNRGITQEEQQYIAQIDRFLWELDRVETEEQEHLNQITDKRDIQGAITILKNCKEPFVQFLQIQAPARFARAHEHLKNGCTVMIEYLDVCVEMIESGDASLENQQKMGSLMDIILTEFSYGEGLLDAAL